MSNYLEIKKVLNNNVIIASHPEHEEVVVIGKGIGFGKKSERCIGARTNRKDVCLKK